MMQKFEKTWNSKTVEHKGFRDLGNYVIELPDFTDPKSRHIGITELNKLVDHGKLSKFGCTCMVKRNSKGEVIFGRNMDLDISQSPAYVFKTTSLAIFYTLMYKSKQAIVVGGYEQLVE